MDLDSPERFDELQSLLKKKRSLQSWYRSLYKDFQQVLAEDPNHEGTVIELGSGGGFIKEVVKDVVTTDIVPYRGVDLVVDATRMPFAKDELRGIFLLNVLHHISDVSSFFAEANRCLRKSGQLLIIDQYPGLWAKPILRHVHHEHFDDRATTWTFPSSGPLSGANGALAWIVFFRDRKRFEREFPSLKIRQIILHSSIIYWLCGGLKKWSLVPSSLYPLIEEIDSSLVRIFPSTASFMTIRLEKV
jgi:SAM-dependent methyltransferase